MGDTWSDRWFSQDPADQFQNISPYVFMGNNPVSITDPDGRFLPLVYAGAALVGGGVNLWSNWRKVKDWKSGLAYFASGAIGGAVSVTNPMAGGAVTAAGNVATDLATGNFPDFKNSKTPLKDGLLYAGGVALDGFAASGAGSISKFVLKGLGFELVKTSVALGAPASPMVATGVGEAVVEEGSEWIVQGVKTPVAEIGAEAINLTTSSTSLASSRTYTIYQANGTLFKFGVTDANFVRMNQSLEMAGPDAYARWSSIMPKNQAHLMEKYLRSLHYNSTGIWELPGMKVPYPHDLNTGLRLFKP